MQYVKKVLVLKSTQNHLENKQRLNGLIRVEIENGVAETHLSLVNLPNGVRDDYFLLFVDSNKNDFEFNLGSRPTVSTHFFPSEPKIDKGFCVGIYLIKDSLPLLLAFASDCNFLTLQDFRKVLAEKCLIKHKKTTEDALSNQLEDCVIEHDQVLPLYNDEAVATENYFEIDDKIKEKILSLKEMENESLQLENELFDCECKKEAQENFATNICSEDETDTLKRKENTSPRHFDTVKEELDQIFFKFPKEESLKNHFKESRWARIYYSQQKYYVVGVVYEEGEEKYICYGVPANYSKTPPKELDGFCSFIPLSVFDMFGAGYWIMFQDANTGKCVRFN